MKSLFISLLLLIEVTAMGQNHFKIETLLDKKWKIVSYDVGGHSFPATDVSEKDYTIFSKDHNVKAVNAGITIHSSWTFDTSKNILTLSSKETDVKSDMKIFVLNDKDFVFETTNEDDLTLKVHMVSDIK